MSDNYAKVKSRKYASDDDAENLLAGILDETEDVARAEQERIEAELAAKEAEERRKKEDAARAKKEEAAAKLSAEMERLQKVEQRRTEKLEALKIEELKARGEWIDPEIERKKLEKQIQEEAERKAMEEAAERKAKKKAAAAFKSEAMPVQAISAEEKKSNNALVLGIVVAVLAAVGAGAAVVLGGYQPDGATYSKAVFAPKEQTVAVVEKAFTPLPKPEPVVAEVEEDTAPTSRRRGRRGSSGKASKPKEKSAPITSKPKQNKANAKSKELESMLNTDVFGGF